MLKILGKLPSINVRKVLWVCGELDLAYEHEEWGSGSRSTQVPEFLSLNPNGMVPVIIDDGFVLWESNTICRYLAARCARHDLLPSTPRERAGVEQWMDWQATEFNNSWRYAFLGLVRHSPEHQDPALLASGIANWNRHMTMLEGQLTSTQAYVTGETFTLADIVLGLSAQRWLVAPMDRPDLPAVRAYHARLSERPGFRKHGAKGMP